MITPTSKRGFDPLDYRFEADAPDAPLAVLEIARLDMTVPVFEGAHWSTLERGAGALPDTALPGESGHVVISAHRDTHFRALQHVVAGDVVALRTGAGVRRYRITRTFVADPLDVDVMAAGHGDVLTLITCHPFGYVGFAPDRFIVRAVPYGPDILALSNERSQ